MKNRRYCIQNYSNCYLVITKTKTKGEKSGFEATTTTRRRKKWNI